MQQRMAVLGLLASTSIIQQALSQDPRNVPVDAQQAAQLLHDGALLVR